MSYSFNVTVQDGEATVDIPTGMAVPDGKFQIGGHAEPDGTRESLNVSRYDSDGAVMSQAMCYATGRKS